MESCSHCNGRGEQEEDTNKLLMKDILWVALLKAALFRGSWNNCQVEGKDCVTEHKSMQLQKKSLFLTISTEVIPTNGKRFIIITLKH